MIRVFVVILIFLDLSFATTPLSENREQLFDIERKKAQKEADKLKTRWISPIEINGFYTKNKSLQDIKESDYSGISMSWKQDIFRSGGIFYAIEYAKALRKYNLLNIDLKEAKEVERVYTLKCQIERDRLKLKQAKLLLENRKIDVLVVKEKYKAGNADIERLNTAILNEEREKDNVISLESLLKQEIYELKKLTGDKSVDISEIKSLKIPSKEEYVEKNMEYLLKKRDIATQKKMLSVKKASYLPKFYVNASLGYKKIEGGFLSGEGKEYSYGLGFNMPLDYNAKKDIESSRLSYLQSKVSKADKKDELSFEYDKRMEAIKSYEEKIESAKRREKLYKELYDFVKEQVVAGFKTDLDLKSLGNSLKIQELEKKIQTYNILIEKVNLYFDIFRE
ncbi:MAG: TolC family protein [Epsilonproteobacteria bacterium]|nr:TolC family protein [Campylobacterota bacterium]